MVRPFLLVHLQRRGAFYMRPQAARYAERQGRI